LDGARVLTSVCCSAVVFQTHTHIRGAESVRRGCESQRAAATDCRTSREEGLVLFEMTNVSV
jgi:hypothetical protein